VTQEQNEPKRAPEGTGADPEGPASADDSGRSDAEIGTDAAAPAQDPEDSHAGDDEDGVDLSDLDGGMDGALDAIRNRGDEPSPEELKSIRRTPPLRRNPWLAAVVMVLGAVVMWSMWADFRFWMRRAPEDLGDANALFEDGAFKENYDNRWVRLRGTPDVQHAARIEVKDKAFGYVRLQEGRGSLYAMVPREDQRRDDQFEGVFEGRMRRLDRSRHFEEAKAFFDGERITSTVDLAMKPTLEAIGDGGLGQGSTVQTEDGDPVRLDDDDLVTIVVKDAETTKFQLGISTWPTDDVADAAVAALGRPWTRVAGPTGASGEERPGAKLKRTLYRTYVVAVPPDKARDLARQLDRAAGVEPGGADPKVGSASLPQTYTYVTSPAGLRMEDGKLAFDHAGNTTEPPYEATKSAEGGSVAPRSLVDGALVLAPGEITAMRLDQQIRLDPHGYVVIVEETPDEHRKWAVLFLIVAVVVGINGAALGIRLRRAART